MTQKELHDQRLVKEAQATAIRMHTRRHFLKESAMGLGALAIGSLLGNCGSRSKAASSIAFDPAHPLLPKSPPFVGKARSVIYLHMAGAPSQLELFDYKPELAKMDGQDCPPIISGRKTICFYKRCAQDVGPAGKVCSTWPKRCMDK